jgi:hypothetical protein
MLGIEASAIAVLKGENVRFLPVLAGPLAAPKKKLRAASVSKSPALIVTRAANAFISEWNVESSPSVG